MTISTCPYTPPPQLFNRKSALDPKNWAVLWEEHLKEYIEYPYQKDILRAIAMVQKPYSEIDVTQHNSANKSTLARIHAQYDGLGMLTPKSVVPLDTTT